MWVLILHGVVTVDWNSSLATRHPVRIDLGRPTVAADFREILEMIDKKLCVSFTP